MMALNQQMSPKEIIENSHVLGSKEEVRDYYKKWSSTYDEDVKKVDYNSPIIGASAIAELLKDRKDAKILDAGAGTGCTAEAMIKHGFHDFDALDACQEMLDIAKEKNIYKKLICEFLGPNRLDIDSDYYDAVIGTGIFLEKHVGPDCLTELIRIVKPGGYAVFVVRAAFLEEDSEIGSFHSTTMEHQDNGKWKLIEKKTVPNMIYGTMDGVVYKCQVL